ncbi:MAG TPA: 16S rRNA (guanine(527)-N(7))-methyltransferase RsmG [Terracidiphilus sp.]|nr:16S rRNA (guanine(527)-N(7))-methyltransferase RsmG [Terracidiphilus sp.]
MSEENATLTGARLNELLTGQGEPSLPADIASRFGAYAALLMRWNARVNLTAIRDMEGILRRHFVESIVYARALPTGIGSFLDLGSGAGFPGIPVALCRPAIHVTLAESQGKKAAFLREAIRVVKIQVEVYAGRAEALDRSFDCVGMRAVDQMKAAAATAAGLVAVDGWLALLTTAGGLSGLKESAGGGFQWLEPLYLEGGSERAILLGRRIDAVNGGEGGR